MRKKICVILCTYNGEKYLRPQIDIMKIYIMPILAAVFMGVLCFGTYELLHLLLGLVGLGSDYFKNLIAMVPTLAVAVLAYAFFLVRSGAMTRSDLQSVPKGAVVIRLLTKLRWLPPERESIRSNGRRDAMAWQEEEQIDADYYGDVNVETLYRGHRYSEEGYVKPLRKEPSYENSAYRQPAYRQASQEDYYFDEDDE